MNKKPISTCAALLLVAAFGTAVTLSNDGIDARAQTMALPQLVENAYFFNVFKHDNDVHAGAAVVVLKTATNRDPALDRYGLLFLQRNADSGKSGEGMVCPAAERLTDESTGDPDDALRCSQCVGRMIETLTVGSLDSYYCRVTLSDKGGKVATDTECRDNVTGEPKVCVCYEIEHRDIDEGDRQTACPYADIGSDKGGFAPPEAGTGSGGRGGG